MAISSLIKLLDIGFRRLRRRNLLYLKEPELLKKIYALIILYVLVPSEVCILII